MGVLVGVVFDIVYVFVVILVSFGIFVIVGLVCWLMVGLLVFCIGVVKGKVFV